MTQILDIDSVYPAPDTVTARAPTSASPARKRFLPAFAPLLAAALATAAAVALGYFGTELLFALGSWAEVQTTELFRNLGIVFGAIPFH